MPFWTDAIRIGGALVAPVLASTGVGIPLAVGIGAVAAGVGHGVAGTIEKNKAENEADEKAANAQKEQNTKAEEQKQENERISKKRADELNKQLEQIELPKKVLTACQENRYDDVPSLLNKMSNETFQGLGMTPIGACGSALGRARVTQMLAEERTRRGL